LESAATRASSWIWYQSSTTEPSPLTRQRRAVALASEPYGSTTTSPLRTSSSPSTAL